MSETAREGAFLEIEGLAKSCGRAEILKDINLRVMRGEVLALILLNPEQEWSLTELANRVGASVSTAQREVSRAEDAGVVVGTAVVGTVVATVVTVGMGVCGANFWIQLFPPSAT